MKYTHHMKFLIVDDEVELCDLMELQILANFEVETFRAFHGQQALQIVEEHGPFDAIICDYRMPQKNGFEVFQILREKGIKTPFLLCSAEVDTARSLFKGALHIEFLEKPFFGDSLTNKILLLMTDKKPPTQSRSYFPVHLDLLHRVESAGVSLFVRLNEDHFIKVLKEFALFNQVELERFQRKNLSHLYVESIDFKTFINNFRKNVFSKIEWKNLDTKSALDNLEEDWSFVVEGNRIFGWSDSVMSLAKENIAKTLELVKGNQQLIKIFEKLNLREKKSYLIPHSYSLVFFTSQILQELGWSSESTLQKLTFAALFHDIDLNETMFTNKLSLIEKGVLDSEVRQPANYQIFHHPMRGAELMQKWSSCPPDVDRIIAQHHEKFDGTGFPQKLNFQTIAPLAGVFILAEDLVYEKINHPKNSMEKYLLSKKDHYSRGDMKPLFEAVLKIAQQIDHQLDL